MQAAIKRRKSRLSKSDIKKLSCFFYDQSNGMLASAFFNLPLPLKQHCVQVSITAEQMVAYAPDSSLPSGMTRGEYANAVRYGCLYHDIGAYLVYNQPQMFPETGERFLGEQIAKDELDPNARRVILETVRFCCERYDGCGFPDGAAADEIPLHAAICAIADQIDTMLSAKRRLSLAELLKARKYVSDNCGTRFSPEAVACLMGASRDIAHLYRQWRKQPPFWNNHDIIPLEVPIERPIG